MGEYPINLPSLGAVSLVPTPKPASAAAIAPLGGAGTLRNDMERRPQPRALPERQVALPPLPDPEPPTGPPPTFAANILEAEEKRLREAVVPDNRATAAAQVDRHLMAITPDWADTAPAGVRCVDMLR